MQTVRQIVLQVIVIKLMRSFKQWHQDVSGPPSETVKKKAEKSGRAQSLSYDMRQTPSKRKRTNTHSPFALNRPLEEVGDHPVDPDILDLINPILAEIEEMKE